MVQDRRGNSRGDPSVDEPQPPPSGGIELRSAAFSDHTMIPHRRSRDGGNTSPPAEWVHVPADTAELALICEDPDAPAVRRPLGVRRYFAGLLRDHRGRAARDGDRRPQRFGELGWGGPQPPIGDEPHRYFFHLYAADRPLGLREGITAEAYAPRSRAINSPTAS
jgi:phosphatidylethanolamine-binding protein (PEBP) family uncharacterized protein